MTVGDRSKTDGSLIPQSPSENRYGPGTEYESRQVIRNGERNDHVEVSDVVSRFSDEDIPSQVRIVRRTITFYGPELLLSTEETNYRLTAPGPDTQLLLWRAIMNDSGYQSDWKRLAEVKVQFTDNPKYKICSQCGEPVRTIQHERAAAINRCPNS